MRFLRGEQVWQEIKVLARQSRSLVAVVGFVGRRPGRLLRWPRKSTVIADLSEARVREGATSARGALELARKGVRVFSYPGLHSKVFLFDRHAVVGSMNLSEESQVRLEEAAVVLSGPRELDMVRRYVRRVLRNAMPEDEQTLRELAKREPRRRPVRTVAVRRRRTGALIPAGRVWLLPTTQGVTAEELRLAEREERKIREEEGVDRVLWYFRCGADVYRRAKPGDWCFFWWVGTKRSYGWLEGPYEVIRPVDLGQRLGDRRYLLAYFRRRGQRLLNLPLDRRALQGLMRVVADRRSPEEAARDPLMWKPRLLRPEEKRRLARWLQRWGKPS